MVSVICACVCVCQDNDPGTRNLEFGHTVVKMKYAASGGFEGSDDAQLETQSSARGPREKHMGRGAERRQHTGREMTVASMRGEVVEAQTSRHVVVCMCACKYVMWVRMYVLPGRCGRRGGWMDVHLAVLRVAKETNTCSVVLVRVRVTVPVTRATSAGSWDGPHPRGASPQQTKIEMVCSKMMMPQRGGALSWRAANLGRFTPARDRSSPHPPDSPVSD